MPSYFRFPILAGFASGALAMLVATGPAQADRIRNPIAVFAGLDKITGRIISFEVAIDEGATCVRVGQALFGSRAPQYDEAHYWPSGT